VSVRVISWIVLHLSAKQAIHEVTRITTKRDQKMTNEKCQIMSNANGECSLLLLPSASLFSFPLADPRGASA